MIRLDDVQELVKPELAEFRKRYDDWIKTGKTPIVDQVVRFLTPRRGKLLRPTLTYLSARLLGECNDRTHFAAVVVELLSNATLLHDDVVDNSDKRRGMPSLNAIFGNKISVLFGDYLLANSLLAMLECGDTRVFEVLARTSRRLAKGELDQAARSRNLDMDEETYYRMVSNKTGALVAAACVLGGLSNGADEEQTTALRGGAGCRLPDPGRPAGLHGAGIHPGQARGRGPEGAQDHPAAYFRLQPERFPGRARHETHGGPAQAG